MFHYVRDPGADGVGIAFTSGALDLSDHQPSEARATAFARVADAVGAAVAVVHQVHGNRVLDVTEPGVGLMDLTGTDADALITGLPGLALAVRVADCVPILLADADARWVGAVHAGRAGVLNGVLGAAIEALRSRGACSLRAWIGPHICGSCYEVPPAMASDFFAATGIPPTRTPWGTTGLDLGAAVRAHLDAAGVPFSSFEACTLHDDGLHSFRCGGASAGRLAGLAWLA